MQGLKSFGANRRAVDIAWFRRGRDRRQIQCVGPHLEDRLVFVGPLLGWATTGLGHYRIGPLPDWAVICLGIGAGAERGPALESKGFSDVSVMVSRQ